MIINFMTWNTRLYEYGNKCNKNYVKPFDYCKCIDTINTVRKYMLKRNSIIVLQEIPLKCNITHSEHIIWTLLGGVFPQDKYMVLYNKNENVRDQIKTTVVIAEKHLIELDDKGFNSNKEDYCNCFVSFKIKDTDLYILAVHQSLSDKEFISDKLDKNPNYKPTIILGDFNAGNYSKKNETNQFKKNRENYKKLLSKGYVDICEGQTIREATYKGQIYKTSIDHILIENTNESLIYNKPNIKPNNLSDHYIITVKLNYKKYKM